MARGVEALVTPDLLRWAREEASYSLDDAAQKAHVQPDALTQWEKGEARPSIPQLRRLADAYRRPLAVFYLPIPPHRAEPVRDYRRLTGDISVTASPALRLEIRKVLRRREIALDLYGELQDSPPSFDGIADLAENPESVGARIRELLRVAPEQQLQWKSDYEAFNAWRAALEGLGILVFQCPNVAREEMLGFSISKNPLPVIAVNVKPHVRARVFTMLHELAHLMLREGGVCDLEENPARPPENRSVEVFCNHVAGAALVPMDHLRELVSGRTVDVDLVATLARRYHVGREVIARRMLTGRWIDTNRYQQLRELFNADYGAPPGGFSTPDTKALSHAGPLFARLVLEGYDESRITINDVTDYLGVRPRYVPVIRERLRRGGLGEDEG